MDTSYVAAVVITGLSVVFITLILLVIFFTIMGKVLHKNKPDNEKISKPKNEPQVTVKSNNGVQKVAVIDDNNDETAAVISAVIAAMGAFDGRNYMIKSIMPSKKARIKTGLPVWGLTGLRENTSPF